ncbi:MAG TPA: SH3 domain-containing protein [Chitinophagaceae bacterium]|nr:SH3 domain-containing protein [Chitinophagaceae bacterium]
MKRNFLLLLILVSLNIAAQNESYFIAARGGLSLRERPDASSKLLDKIPYSTKVTLIQTEEEWVPVSVEGIKGYWRKVKYNNKTGYIVDCYLFNQPPPKTTVKDLSGYLAQISVPFGNKLIVKSGNMNNMEEAGWELQKQLYKNGGEWHRFVGYEYGSETYFLPDFTLQQAFLLIRMIPQFKEVFGENEPFPSENRTFTKDQREYAIKVQKENYGADFEIIEKISVEYEDGAIYNFELYQIDNQVVIFLGAGV